jgi:asparagine synthase (glutamine-hydrolysing)
MWPEIVWFGDRPPVGPSDAALLNVARRCHADGVKVLLTGEGADELLGGYPWHRHTWRLWRRNAWPRRLFRTPKTARREGRRLELAPLSSMVGRGDPLAMRHLMFAMDAETETRPLHLLERLKRVEPAADRAFHAHGLDDLDRHLTRILHRHDRMGMAASMEMRVPFLENAMYDLAFHLPRRAKLRRGRSKWLLKTLASERLPRDVVHAPKKGFPMPTHYYRGCEEIVRGGVLAEHLGWSARNLDVLLPLARETPSIAWSIASVELWLRLFFHDERSEDLGEMLVRRLG